jgi:hypothetical protein
MRTTEQRVALAVIVGASALLVWSRLANLGTSFWHDEAVTVVRFVDRGPSAIFTNGYEPNNHVLYSFLSWGTVTSLGKYEPIYRFWSVAPGLVAIGVLTWWSWRRFEPAVAAVVVALAAFSPMHLVLTPQARGYGLALLASSGLLIVAVRLSERGKPLDVALFAACGSVGIWTLPVFVLAFVAHGAVVFVQRTRRVSVVVATAAVGVISLLFYAALVDDVVRSSNQRFGRLLPWNGFLTGPFDDIARRQVSNLVPGQIEWMTERWFVAVVCVVVIGLSIRRLLRIGEGLVLAHLVVPIVGTYLVLTIGRFYVSPRFVSFLLPYVLLLLALGIWEAVDLVRRTSMLTPLVLVGVVLVAIVGTRHVTQHVGRLAALPYENPKEAAAVARGTGIDAVLTHSSGAEGLQFYLGSEQLRFITGQEQLDRILCFGRAPFVYIDHSGDGEPPTTNSRCLRTRGATLVRIPQERHSAIGSRERFEVWVVRATARRAP